MKVSVRYLIITPPSQNAKGARRPRKANLKGMCKGKTQGTTKLTKKCYKSGTGQPQEGKDTENDTEPDTCK